MIQLLLLLVAVFSVGWPGTERYWYLRAFEGNKVRGGEIWGMTWGYFGRFLRLGLLMAIVLAPVLILALREASQSLQPFTTAQIMMLVLVTFVIDVALTFVTPALAFHTNSAFGALGIGLRMLRREWPASLPYALLPPLAIISLSWTDAATTPLGSVLPAVGGVLLALLFKGATVRFYLRAIDALVDRARPPPMGEPEPIG